LRASRQPQLLRRQTGRRPIRRRRQRRPQTCLYRPKGTALPLCRRDRLPLMKYALWNHHRSRPRQWPQQYPAWLLQNPMRPDRPRLQ
jgi:hypothetical protein